MMDDGPEALKALAEATVEDSGSTVRRYSVASSSEPVTAYRPQQQADRTDRRDD
jgi:hypothetical protein